jgi:catecholate siderophore receptor
VRRKRRTIDVPQSVTVVSVKQIEDQATNSISDAIRYVPGVFSAQGEGNRETLVFRGNSTTGDFFVDGVRDDVQTYRDLYNIERLEIFKGPNAMIFGRGGIGGIVNRVLRGFGAFSARA